MVRGRVSSMWTSNDVIVSMEEVNVFWTRISSLNGIKVEISCQHKLKRVLCILCRDREGSLSHVNRGRIKNLEFLVDGVNG